MMVASASDRMPASVNWLMTATSPDAVIVGAAVAPLVSAIEAVESCCVRFSESATPPFGTKVLVPCAAMPAPSPEDPRALPEPKNIETGAVTVWKAWDTPTVRKLLPTVVVACTALAVVFEPE